MQESNKLLEREFWNDIVKTPEWKYLSQLLRDHKAYLDKQTLVCVRTNKLEEAKKFQAKSEDVEVIVNLINERIREVNKDDRTG